MARKLDDQQRTELAAFLNQVADAAGYTTTAEWARDSGIPASNLSNMRNGKRAVDGYNLLRLMRAAAVRMDADGPVAVPRRLLAAADGDRLPFENSLRLEALEAKVSELPTAEDLGRAVATLQGAIDSLASRGTREVQQEKPARRRGAR